MNVYRNIKNIYSDVYYHFQNPESLQEGSLKSVPNDVLKHIFSFLSFEKILKISKINKNWKIVSDDPALLKYVIYRDKLMNPDKFKFHLGYNLGINENKKAWDSLPDNIGEIFKGRIEFQNKKIGETHLFAWIPKNANINNIGKLLKGKFTDQNDYHFIGPTILDQFGDEPIKDSSWIAIKIIPRRPKATHHYRHCGQVLDIQFGNYRKPKIVEAIICLSFLYFSRSKKYHFPEFDTYCHEIVNNVQVSVRFSMRSVEWRGVEFRSAMGISIQ